MTMTSKDLHILRVQGNGDLCIQLISVVTEMPDADLRVRSPLNAWLVMGV